MKKHYLILVFYAFSCTYVYAADKYWVGPSGGNWTDENNWSFTNGGPGGAPRPSATDDVIFSGNALVNVNISAIIYSLRTTIGQNSVTLYTSIGSTLTIQGSLRVEPFSILKDSTSASVAFNVVFNGATNATGDIFGDWVFEGGVPLTGGSANGAKFTAENGSRVTVSTAAFFGSSRGGKIIFKKNTNAISSTPASLKFSYGTSYVLDNNLSGAIPAATWAKDSVQVPNTYNGIQAAEASTILISGDIANLQILGAAPVWGRLVIDLPALSSDFNLGLPDGARVLGNVEILNTNGRTVTMLASTGPGSSVQVEIGTTEQGYTFGGYFNISGNSKVALAKAIAAAPATSYKLLVNKTYNQSSGNFSLQDYDGATGSSTLAVKNDLLQSGGTFITNSSSTSSSAKFVVVMADPNYITGPSGDFSSLRTINISSGSIDNARHMVTLRIDHSMYSIPGFEILPNGVILQSPLTVGRLDLARSPLTTSSSNLLTVSDPSSNAITIGNTGKSYVNGPLRRAANSTGPYSFPVGKGNSTLTSYFFDSCSVTPVSTTASLYQAEYFHNSYSDLNVSSPLKGVANDSYWDISKIFGSDALVRLSLSGTVSGASSGDGLVTAQYVGGHWVSDHGSVLTPGNATSGSVISKPVSSFSPFTFGYANPADLGASTSGGLSYKFYLGTYTTLPDFNSFTPASTGNSANVDIGVRPAGTNDGFAFVWQGTITIPTAGTYTFETVSDDGSKLYFNTTYNAGATALVNNDGIHPSQSATGTVNVPAAGSYPITVTYFENNGGEGMQVYWSGPGISRQQIPDAAFNPATQPANGLSYKFYQGVYNTLPDFSALTPVKTGNINNVDINIRPAGVNDGFAFLWEGFINITTPGTYTFETNSDDGSKLYFNAPYNANATALVNNDGLHAAQSATGTVNIPAAGLYPIAITFFENNGGEGMQVYWSGPGIGRQLIPDAAFMPGTPQNVVTGLNYRYYEGDFNQLPDYSSLTPVKTGATSNVDISVRTAGVNDHFAFIWDGYINLPSAGTYTFETISDDGSKVYVNIPYSVSGASTVNNDGLHAPVSATGTITVAAAGRYPITITYFEKDGGETMQLYWSGPGINRQLVPDVAFSVSSFAGNISAIQSPADKTVNPAKGGNGGHESVRAYPNPFDEKVTIDYYNGAGPGKKAVVELYDRNGKLIYTYRAGGLNAGLNRWTIHLDSGNIGAGVYMAQVKINGIPAQVIKLVKSK